MVKDSRSSRNYRNMEEHFREIMGECEYESDESIAFDCEVDDGEEYVESTYSESLNCNNLKKSIVEDSNPKITDPLQIKNFEPGMIISFKNGEFKQSYNINEVEEEEEMFKPEIQQFNQLSVTSKKEYLNSDNIINPERKKKAIKKRCLNFD